MFNFDVHCIDIQHSISKYHRNQLKYIFTFLNIKYAYTRFHIFSYRFAKFNCSISIGIALPLNSIIWSICIYLATEWWTACKLNWIIWTLQTGFTLLESQLNSFAEVENFFRKISSFRTSFAITNNRKFKLFSVLDISYHEIDCANSFYLIDLFNYKQNPENLFKHLF